MAGSLWHAVDAMAWQRDALCIEYADVGDWWLRGPTSAARAVCADCLCRRDCLEYALTHEVDVGVWGGLSSTERAYARARGLDADAILDRDHGRGPSLRARELARAARRAW